MLRVTTPTRPKIINISVEMIFYLDNKFFPKFYLYEKLNFTPYNQFYKKIWLQIFIGSRI